MTALAPINTIDCILEPHNFQRISDIMRDKAGIILAEEKRNLVHSRLMKRLRELDLHSFDEYCDLISSKEGRGELRFMLNALTTNVTSLFREQHHFDHLKSVVLPEILADESRGNDKIRIWSAGCSMGLEPYSIAMSVQDALPESQQSRVQILATDIDTKMVQAGKTGLYTQMQLRGVSDDILARYFKSENTGTGTQYEIKPSIRDMVTFRKLNLMDNPWPMRKKFDVIFCRNVTIYFYKHITEKVLLRFSEQMKMGGYLYIGHSERLIGKASEHFETVDVTSYRKIMG